MAELHPLIDPTQSHYNNEDGTNSIKDTEDKYNMCKVIGFCQINIDKYTKRLDKKGQKESDLVKIQNYKNYLKVLEDIAKKYPYLEYGSVSMAFKTVGINYRYK